MCEDLTLRIVFRGFTLVFLEKQPFNVFERELFYGSYDVGEILPHE